jgi:hypothetical protein
MSIYGHFADQYYRNKINFPKESFLIAGISYYQQNLIDIDFDSEIIMKLEPENKYDSQAIQIIFNSKVIGYVPRNDVIKKMCIDNISSNLKVINIKKDYESNNYGIRVIPNKYYTEELNNIGIF